MNFRGNFDPSYGTPSAGTAHPQQWQQGYSVSMFPPQQDPPAMQKNQSQHQPYQQQQSYYQPLQQYYDHQVQHQQLDSRVVIQQPTSYYPDSVQTLSQPHPSQHSSNQTFNPSVDDDHRPPLPVEPPSQAAAQRQDGASCSSSGGGGVGGGRGGGTIAAIKAEIARKRKAMAEAAALSSAPSQLPVSQHSHAHHVPDQSAWAWASTDPPPWASTDPPPLPQEIDEHQALDMLMRQKWAEASQTAMAAPSAGYQPSTLGMAGDVDAAHGSSSIPGSTTPESPPPLPPPDPSTTSHELTHGQLTYGPTTAPQAFQVPYQQSQQQVMFHQSQHQMQNFAMQQQQQLYQQQQMQQQMQLMQQQVYQQQQHRYAGTAWTGQQYAVQYPGSASAAVLSMFGHNQSSYVASASIAAASQGGHAPYQQPYPAMMMQSSSLATPTLQPTSTSHTASNASATGAASASLVSAAAMNITPVAVDARKLLLPPGRLSRPKRILVILRGLPGSGKSHVARVIRETEAEHGGEAPRILSLDEYFVTEVEKEVTDDADGGQQQAGAGGRGKAPSSRGGVKKRTVTELEYVYDHEMEVTYQRSLSKAACKALEEARSPFLVVDAPHLRLDEFRDLWATAQRCHYEAFVMKPLDSDPVSCHSRNIHGRSVVDIKSALDSWEESPVLYTLLDFKPLTRAASGDDHIKEVDMGDDEAVQMDSGRQADVKAKGDISESDVASATAGAIGGSADSGDQSSRTGDSSRLRSLNSATASSADADDGDEEETGRLEASAAITASRWSVSDPEDAEGRAEGKRIGGVKRARASPSAASGPCGITEADLDLLRELDGDLATADTETSSRAKPGSLAAPMSKRLRKQPRRVWWPDQQDDEGCPDGGFVVKSSKQLVVVHYVEGLGPAKGDTAMQYMLAPGGTLAPGGLAAGRNIPGLPQVFPVAAAGGSLAEDRSAFAGVRAPHSFAEQVKAEHNSEHDLVLHLGKQLMDEDDEEQQRGGGAQVTAVLLS